MKKSAEFFWTLPFYSFVLGVFLIIVCKDVLSNGMFLDGLIFQPEKWLSIVPGFRQNKRHLCSSSRDP
jgi:hypothetical protein